MSRGVAAPGRPWSKVRAVHAICVVFWPCDITLHLGTSKNKRGDGPATQSLGQSCPGERPQTTRLNTTEQVPPGVGGGAPHAAKKPLTPSPTPGNTWHGSDAVSNTKHERCRNPASDSLRIPRRGRRPWTNLAALSHPPCLSSPRPHPLFSRRPGCSTERDLRHV